MALLADLVLIVHSLYVVFVVGGLVLIWLGYALGWRWVRNRRFRVAHCAAIGIVAIEVVIGMTCPLTTLEDAMRPGEQGGVSFIQRWVHATLFWDWPPWVFTAVYLGFTAVVALTFVRLQPEPHK